MDLKKFQIYSAASIFGATCLMILVKKEVLLLDFPPMGVGDTENQSRGG